MEIVCIFEEQLYAFRYEGNEKDEFNRLMDLWTDVGYLYNFAKKNKVENIPEFVQDRLKDAEHIQDFLDHLSIDSVPFEFYFEPLKASEKLKSLSLNKGKLYKNGLRYYAIKIDKNCFVITGGAIKMSQTMQDHPDTSKELLKLEKGKSYLMKNGVIDDASFYELLNEDLW
jgi:hypothetical protein